MKRLLVGVLALVTCTLIGCGGTENAKVQEKEKEVVSEDTEKVLTIGAGRDFFFGEGRRYYIHKSTNIWEGFMTEDENMNPIPDLAKSMEVSEDGLTWTIKLNEGIKFHDGSMLTAEVAKANLLRIYHFNSAEKKVVEDYKNTGALGEIKEIRCIDDYTLEVEHENVVPTFEGDLAYFNSEMFSLDSFNDLGQIVKPLGTGPYVFDKYDEQNQVITLKKFDDYRKGEPKVDVVEFKCIPDPDTRLAALRSGDIDAIADVGSILPTQASLIENDENLVLNKQKVGTNHYFYMNMNEGKFFNDIKLRKALNLLTDRETIVNTLLEGHGTVANTLVTPVATKWAKEGSYTYNFDEAKKLIDEALKGKKETIKILVSSNDTARWPYKDVMTFMQGQLTKVGIESEIEIVDGPTCAEKMKNGEYDLSIGSYSEITAEPTSFFARTFGENGDLNTERSYGYKNQESDDIIASLAREKDEAKRIEYYTRLQEIGTEDMNIIPIWHDIALFATNKKVKNLTLDLNFWPNLYEVDIQE